MTGERADLGGLAGMTGQQFSILDEIQAWFRAHGDDVWPSEVRAHPHTDAWMRSEWSAPADAPAPHLSGALSNLGVPVRVDERVPSGTLRVRYTDGSERDERVYGDRQALRLAVDAFGQQIGQDIKRLGAWILSRPWALAALAAYIVAVFALVWRESGMDGLWALATLIVGAVWLGRMLRRR